MIPLRALSRAWGWVNRLELPVWARQSVYTWYINSFGCNLEEAEVQDLVAYKNLGEFFQRRLKEGVRPVDKRNCVVSPADGTVLHLGEIDSGRIEQVKGVTYSLQKFLGPLNWNHTHTSDCDESYHQSLLTNPKKNTLYHCVIYLAPGDYHRFHSPVSWEVNFRRHFPGELLSVKPSIAGWIAGLFNLNERVVYTGKWQHGFFSLTAVGATNVGSIQVHFDQTLHTNCRGYPMLKKRAEQTSPCECFFSNKKMGTQGILCQKGEEFGQFNLGSTIVLIFEAPKNSQFEIKDGDKVRVGQALNLVAGNTKSHCQ